MTKKKAAIGSKHQKNVAKFELKPEDTGSQLHDKQKR